ncbi:MAG: hypothetical protein KDD43_04210, partial [Bdellovibrionales bacterium]|nr:hypothetical protein [Bdellovibrionales bacterium]
DAVDEILMDETGSAESNFPTLEQDLPETDPDLPKLGQPSVQDDGPWDKVPDQEQIDDAGGEISDEETETLPEEESSRAAPVEEGEEPVAPIDPEPTEDESPQ